MERVTGIEPAWPAWKAGTLPLSYTRVGGLGTGWDISNRLCRARQETALRLGISIKNAVQVRIPIPYNT